METGAKSGQNVETVSTYTYSQVVICACTVYYKSFISLSLSLFLLSLGILKLSKSHKEQNGEEKCKLHCN